MMSTDTTLLRVPAFPCRLRYTDSEAAAESGGPATGVLDQFVSHQVLNPESSTSNAVKCETQVAKRQTRREKEMIRKRQYHRRLKSERETLRKMVEELSRQLQELQRVNISTKLGSTGILADSTWRDVAVHQRHQRVLAEAEQRRLFTAAKMQASYIKKLCDELPNGFAQLIPPGIAWSGSPHPTRPPVDESMYQALVERVDACYTQIDDVLGEFNRDGVTSSVHQNEFDGEVPYFQHLNQFTEPYDYEHTHPTMWKLAKLLHRQRDRRDVRGVGDLNDTVVIRFRLVHALTSGAGVSMVQRYVHRRFREDKRTILVWKTLSEGEGVFRGVHAEVTGWVCLQPSVEEGSTLVRVCVRQAPATFQAPDRRDSDDGEFHRVLQNSVSEDMQAISGALDKMLLDDTLEGIDI
ncbi:hypothetical protein PF008_g19243 [Phytophthora fragariae]|uniref:BZIP domain-containing protein n=1 Tax=Phytophthora fragariae TaxID=53985 RepID=A0A6G0R396_9STRA|nr:hypothetical protein PF008_g19243 [Phytophthora fragariae]